MKLKKNKKNLIVFLSVCVIAIALLVTSISFALNLFTDSSEKTVNFGSISLDSSTNNAFESSTLDNIINGQKIADEISFTRSSSSNVDFYMRIQFVYTTNNNSILPRNQLQYLARLNNMVTPETVAGYRWSERQGDYFYLYTTSDNMYKVGAAENTKFIFLSNLYYDMDIEVYPTEYAKPNGLKLIINVQAIQANYLSPTTPSKELIVSKFNELFATTYYTPVTFDISFDANGGSGVGPADSSVEYNENYTLPSCSFIKANYTLRYWLDGTDFYYPGDTCLVTRNVKFKAVWKIMETPENMFVFTSVAGGYTIAKNTGYTLPSYVVLPTMHNGLPVVGVTAANIVSGGFVGANEIVSILIPKSDLAYLAETIPENINKQYRTINQYAFYNCRMLSSVVIEADVTSIGDYTFSLCNSLLTIDTGNAVTSIGQYCFSGCQALKSVNLSDSVTTIGQGGFRDCSRLKEINLPRSLTSISNYLFSKCTELISISIPLKVTSIGYYAFASEQGSPMKLSSVYYEHGAIITSIGTNCFEFCQSLEQIDIPASVSLLSNYTFNYCTSLKSVNFLGTAVHTIGYSCFGHCTSLEGIDLPVGLTSIGSFCFNNCTKLLQITIPTGVTILESNTFKNCSNLRSVTAPQLTSLGVYCFADCLQLEDANSRERLTFNSLTSISDYAFSNCGKIVEFYCPAIVTIGNQAFIDCASLKGVNHASYISIPSSATSIGQYAFKNCSGVLGLKLNSSTTTLGVGAFYNCSKLHKLNNSNWFLWPATRLSIPNYLFYNCGILCLEFESSGSTYSIGVSAFENCSYISILKLNSIYFAFGSNSFYNSGTQPSLYNELYSQSHSIISESYLSGPKCIRNLSIDAQFSSGGLVVVITKPYSESLQSAISTASNTYYRNYAEWCWEDSGAWDGIASTSFGGGDGTEQNPYLISTPNQFAYLSNQVAGGQNFSSKYFMQTNSLDFGNRTMVVGNNTGSTTYYSGNSFNGTYIVGRILGYRVTYGLDGNKGLVPIQIKNISSNTTGDQAYSALFSKIGPSGLVRGICLNASVFIAATNRSTLDYSKGGAYSGTIAAINDGTIANCNVGYGIKVPVISNGVNLTFSPFDGATITTVRTCTIYVTMSNAAIASGTGFDYGSVTVGSTSYTNYDNHAGGIAAQMHKSTGNIQVCFVGTVVVRSYAKRYACAGGICGSCNSAFISDCITLASTTSRAVSAANTSYYTMAFAGAISGVLSGVINNCRGYGGAIYTYAENPTNTTTRRDHCASYSGGLVGYMHDASGSSGSTYSLYNLPITYNNFLVIYLSGTIYPVGCVNSESNPISISANCRLAGGVQPQYIGRIAGLAEHQSSYFTSGIRSIGNLTENPSILSSYSNYGRIIGSSITSSASMTGYSWVSISGVYTGNVALRVYLINGSDDNNSGNLFYYLFATLSITVFAVLAVVRKNRVIRKLINLD